MKALTKAVLVWLVLMATEAVGHGAPLPEALANTLKAAIQKECPDAKFEVAGDSFIAKHKTMLFTVHDRLMTGEIRSQTRQQEGPNYKGFLLQVTLQPGRETPQALTPQTIREPYWSTYINNPPTSDGKDHYWVSFSYGGRLDQKLKAAILEAISVENLSAVRPDQVDSTAEQVSPAGKAK